MKKCDVPEYLLGSDFFQALADADNSDIVIPDNCCKLDTNVSSCEELRHLLSTMRFWGVQEIPVTCIKYVIENFSMNVCTVLEEFKADFYLYRFMNCETCSFKRLIKKKRAKYSVDWAVACNALEVLRYYHSVGTVIDAEDQLCAVRYAKFECFQFIYEVTQKFAVGICEYAVEHDRLDALQLAHEHGAAWGKAFGLCIIYRNSRCLQYALDNGCPGMDKALQMTALSGDFDLLKYLLDSDKGATPFPRLCYFAAYRKVDCLRLAHERGYPMDAKTLVHAAEGGALQCMQYAREHGCPWTEEVATAAVDYGTADCFVYAHTSGCPMPTGIAALAARRARIEHLQYMFSLTAERPLELSIAAAAHEYDRSLRFVHAQGCPVDLEVMRTAALTGGLESLQYLHRECRITWDCSVFAAAASGGHMFIVTYLHENGCPWDSHTCLNAAQSGQLRCLKYACENGCDRTGLAELASTPTLASHIRDYIVRSLGCGSPSS